MSSNSFEVCPRCGAAIEAGFSHRANGLSYVAPEKLAQFVSIDEDLAKAGLAKFLPSKAAYFRSFVCRDCDLYLIDFSETLDRKQAQDLALRMVTNVQLAQ